MGDKNAYYRPEELGLEIVAEIDYSSQSYEYDTRVVWRHVETGKLYTARDSGCSCPTPFESYQSIEDLEPVSLIALDQEVREVLAGRYVNITPEEGQEFLALVRAAIQKPRRRKSGISYLSEVADVATRPQ